MNLYDMVASLVDVPDPDWEETWDYIMGRLAAREQSGELATLHPEVRKAGGLAKLGRRQFSAVAEAEITRMEAEADAMEADLARSHEQHRSVFSSADESARHRALNGSAQASPGGLRVSVATSSTASPLARA